MDQQKLNYFKERLLEEKERLGDDLERAHRYNLDQAETDSISELSSYDNHPADLGSETFEREKDLALWNNSHEMIGRINEALGRTDTGQYGICEDCGREISEERLEAVPYTTFCIDCQRKEEDHYLNRERPIEEESLSPPFGRTFLDRTENVGTDGEDIWQSVARYGTSDTPSDLGGVKDYNEMYIDSDEPQGIVSQVEAVTDFDDGDIPEDPETYHEVE